MALSRPNLPRAWILALLPITACGEASEADCDRVADKIVSLALAETEPGEAGAKAAEAARPRVRARCLEDRPTLAELECIVAVTDKDQLPDC